MCWSVSIWEFLTWDFNLWAENPELKGVARDIEQATNGRLKVDMAEHFTWDVQKYPLQITIGSKPSS